MGIPEDIRKVDFTPPILVLSFVSLDGFWGNPGVNAVNHSFPARFLKRHGDRDKGTRSKYPQLHGDKAIIFAPFPLLQSGLGLTVHRFHLFQPNTTQESGR